MFSLARGLVNPKWPAISAARAGGRACALPRPTGRPAPGFQLGARVPGRGLDHARLDELELAEEAGHRFGVARGDRQVQVLTDGAREGRRLLGVQVGSWYLDLSDDGVSVAVQNGLTGSLKGVTYTDSGSVGISTFLMDAFGGDQVVTQASGNFLLQLGGGEAVAAGAFFDTLASWGASDTLQGGNDFYGDVIFSGGAAASIASGTGSDSITAAGANASVAGSSNDHITVSGHFPRHKHDGQRDQHCVR